MISKKIIFNADDLGMSHEIDREILSAARCGLIDSASVSVVNGLNSAQFQKYLALEPPIPLGLHLNLTEGCPLSTHPKIAKLINPHGEFKSAVHLLSIERDLSEEALYEEMIAQLRRFVQLSGTKPSHIDSHQHFTYLSPIVFRAFLKMAKTENLRIRSPIPFLNVNRLQLFIESVRQRYGVSIPFSSETRAQELRDVFTDSEVEVRTDDCLIEISSEVSFKENFDSRALWKSFVILINLPT
ncbi:MAG: ChbG/HpnK family deacetylase [Bdellovibrionales bacterium]|nr:ChbG/HpnK family deacetylase [Bdellovibrionales bacterium]